MPLVLEDDTGRAEAESYVSAANCASYAVSRGFAFDITDTVATEATLRRATAFVDAYRARLPGYRVKRRGQALAWPRTAAYSDVPLGAAVHAPIAAGPSTRATTTSHPTRFRRRSFAQPAKPRCANLPRLAR